MPRNTIQIRLKRISTSVHSAGCSSTKRVTIWNRPRPAATAIIAHASAIDSAVQAPSMRRNVGFNAAPVRSAAATSLVIADAVDRGLAELLFELGVHLRQRGDELGLVGVLDHVHALGA